MNAPQLFCEVSDKKFGLLGFLSIDRTVNGKACGGIRWGPHISKDEIRALGYDMTLKYGFCNIRLGGAKSGIIAPFEMVGPERRERLLAFGRQLAPLLRSRVYIPGADLGTNHQDMLTVLEGAGIKLSDQGHGEQAGYYTGLNVVQAVTVALKHLGISLSNASVALEGFGKVGGTIGQLLADLNIKVVAISTKHGALYNPEGLDIKKLLGLRDVHNAAWIEKYTDAERMTSAQLYLLPADVLVPCAGPWMIHEGNVDKIQAKAVVPGANIPATRPIQERLEKRGVLYLPDFICNSGGILANTLEWRGLSRPQLESFFRGVLTQKMELILKRAVSLKRSPAILAEELALENMEKLQEKKKEKKSLGKALSNPGRSIQFMASNYYRGKGPMKNLAAPLAEREAEYAFWGDNFKKERENK